MSAFAFSLFLPLSYLAIDFVSPVFEISTHTHFLRLRHSEYSAYPQLYCYATKEEEEEEEDGGTASTGSGQETGKIGYKRGRPAPQNFNPSSLSLSLSRSFFNSTTNCSHFTN